MLFRSKKPARTRKPKDSEESSETKAKRSRKKTEEKPAEDKEAPITETSEKAGKENAESPAKAGAAADITAENQDHSPIDDVKLEFSASEEVNDHSLEEAVNSADQEGSDKHEE